jgi:hypothetical protein
MKATVYIYWTNFLQPEDEPHYYLNDYKFEKPPESWVYVCSREVEFELPARSDLAAQAVEAIDKKIEELRAECQVKVTALETWKMKFLALEG